MAEKTPSKLTPRTPQEIALDSARLEALFASIGEGIIATDETGTITRINQVALKLLGMRRSDVMHKRFTSAIVAVHENGTPVDVFDRPIVKAIQTGQVIMTRTLYLRRTVHYCQHKLPFHQSCFVRNQLVPLKSFVI
jgi:PAS domain-containing protein